MNQQEKDELVAKFIAGFVNRIPYFLDNGIMDSFDVKFSYNGNEFRLALLKNGQVKGKDFDVTQN